MNNRNALLIGSAVLALCLAGAPRASATNGKWNVNAAGNWSNPANWTNSQIPGDVVGSVANISYNITGNRTVTVDQMVTVGRLRFNDDTTSSHDWTLASSGGNIVTLQVTTGSPIIDVGNRTATFNSSLLWAGSQGFVKIGGGALSLANSGNTTLLGGTIIVGGGTLNLNNTSMSNSYTGKYLVTNGVLRVTSEPCIGPYPASPVADLITLKTGGYLMNNSSDVVLGPNIGITVDATGGGIQAGWSRFLTINGVISGSGPLTLRCDATPGAISLNANNTYTGQTTIGNTAANNSWCWVLVNGSLSAASAVQVYTNGSLGGFGTVNGPVTVRTNGIIAPGGLASPGTLTINNNVIMTNATLKVDLANTTTAGAGVNDLLQVNGNLMLRGTITVTINALAGALANGTYRLINYTGTPDLADFTFVCDNPRLGATFDTSTPGQINMTIANGSPTALVWTGINGIYWDIAVTTNFLNGIAPDVFYQGDAVKFDDSGAYGGGVTVAAAAGPNFGIVQPASVTVDTTNVFTLTSAGNARLGGAMNLYKGGTGILTLSQGNNSQPNIYDGVTIVTNGVLKIGNARALGTTNGGTIVTNLGQFDTSGQGGIVEPMVLQGSGPDGSGVVVNSGANTVNDGLVGPVTLAGDVTFNGSGRFDIYGGGLQGNGHKITKLGANEVSIANQGETGLGDLDVTAGQLTILGNTWATSPGSRVSVVSNAVFAFWAMNNDAGTAFTKDIALTNGNFRSNSGTNYHAGTVTLDGTNGITSTAHMSLLGPVVGPGALNKVGAGVLELEGTNTYSGVTFVSAGTLTLGANATFANTPLITVTNGATLDVLLPAAGLQLGPGQTLAGSGTVNGNVSAAAGASVIPGSTPGTLTINGTLGLNNAFLPFELSANTAGGNDFILANSVVPSGVNTIKIIPLAALDTLNPYTLISVANPMPSGSEANFAVTTDSRYNFNLLPTDNSAGYNLQVQVSGSGSAALLTWQGADPVNPTIWDLKTTSNWLNGATVDKFYSGDTAVFDDSAVGTTANLVGTVQPGSVLLSNVSKSITIGGSGALVTATLQAEGAGTTTLTNSSANQFVNGVTSDAGTLVIANSAANDFGPGIFLNGKMVFNQPLDVTVTTPFTGGAGTLEKANTNTLTLNAINTSFSGPINVNNGVLRAGVATAVGDVNVAMNVKPGGSLNVNGQNLAAKTVNAAGAGYNGMGAIMNTGGNQNNALLNVTLTGDVVFGGPNRWDIRNSSAAMGTLNMAGGGTYGITKIGSQQFSLVNVTVAPTLGDIDVQAGIFSYEVGTTGLGDPTKLVTVHSNATLFFYNSTNAVDKRIQMDGGSILRVNSGTANKIVGPVTLGDGIVTLNGGSGFTLSLDGPVSGPGSLVKNEQSTFSFGASNSFTSDVVINRGNLVISNDYAMGTNKTVVVNYNTADTGGNGTRLFVRGGITTPADLVGLYSALNFPGDYRCSITSDVLTNTWAGPTVLEGSGLVQFRRDNATAGFNITGPIYGTNGFTGVAFFRGSAGYGGLISGKVDMPDGVLAITDNSAWQFSNPADVWKTNRIAYGRFILGADNAGCASAVFELGQPGTSSGTLDLNGFNQTVPLIYTLNGANHWITNGSDIADSVLTYAGGATPSTLDGRIADGPRNLSLTVSSGTLSLLGNNTYKGNTLVSAGSRLALGPAAALGSTPLITLHTGATLDTSAMATGLTLGAGQTLAGTGTVEGSLTIGSGATLSAGASIGAITITNTLTFVAGGTNVAEVNTGATPSCDVVNAASIIYGGTLVVNNLGPALTITDSFKLFNAASYAGAFDQILPASPAPGLFWDASSLAVNGTLKLMSVSLTPIAISAVFTSGSLELSWPADHIGWRLEAQTNSINVGLSNNWVTVPGSTSTNAVSIGVDTSPNAVFFRLVYP